jgi:NitT/TauT family transport system substrate-binding protein
MATSVKIALDWTPNTNHAGFYVAKAQGLYAKAGLDVSFISPHSGEVRLIRSRLG